jgi:plasmid stabilization system protein ParE
MTPRYVFAPQAALDLVEIWQYLKERGGVTLADKVESAILERIWFLSRNFRCRSLPKRSYD